MSVSQKHSLSLADLQIELITQSYQGNLETLRKRILEGICRVYDIESAGLFLVGKSHVDWAVCSDTEIEFIKNQFKRSSGGKLQLKPQQQKGIIWECIRSSAPVIVNELNDYVEINPSYDAPPGLLVRSLLCAPLIVEGEILGAVQLLNRKHGEFIESDRESLIEFSAFAASVLHGATLVENLKAAVIDLENSRKDLTNSRNTLRVLFDNLPLAIYIVDFEYNILAINESRAARANRLPDSMVKRVCYEVLFERSEPCRDCRVMETLKSGVSTHRTEWREIGGDRAKGKSPGENGMDWEIQTYPIVDDQGQAIQAIVVENDITEKYHLENILARSEKLAVIGQLAAGVAHEINNPLTAIIANAQILHRELPPDHDLQESVELISRAGARAAQVVRNLLDFARKEDYRLGLTDVNETVERALELVRHEIMARGAQLDFKPDAKLPSMLASEDHLQSVWLNLLLNAIDALDKEPGLVTVTTHREGSYIHIRIKDNGKGIPEERLGRIFEPFYTTKAPGRGTGLGLSVSHRIVKQHGGNIRVESQAGMGSEFTVILPAG